MWKLVDFSEPGINCDFSWFHWVMNSSQRPDKVSKRMLCDQIKLTHRHPWCFLITTNQETNWTKPKNKIVLIPVKTSGLLSMSWSKHLNLRRQWLLPLQSPLVGCMTYSSFLSRGLNQLKKKTFMKSSKVNTGV